MSEKQTFVPKKFTTKQINLPTFDVDKHDGTKANIELVEEGMQETVNGQKPVVKVYTNVIDIFNGKEIRVTRTFWLSENKETGEMGWTPESDMAKFLIAKKVEHYNDLMGKIVVLVVESDAKTKKRFLTFR